MLTPGSKVDIFPLPERGLAPMRDAVVIQDDDFQLLVRYRFRDARHERDTVVPWANIGRVEIQGGAL